MTNPIRTLILVCLFSFAWSAFGVAFATEAAKTDRATSDQTNPPPGPSWVVTCSNMNPKSTLACATQQTLYLSQTRQKVVSFTVELSQQNSDALVANIQLPHGVLLQEGVQILVDKVVRQKLKILRADENGSYSSFPLDEKMIAAMTAGKTLGITVKGLTGDELVMELTLNDFAISLAMVRLQRVVQSMAAQQLR